MKQILIASSLAALALFSSGCCRHQADSFYVPKDSQCVFKISPKLLGEWKGKVTEYDKKGAPGKSYDCTLEIRDTQTWILRGFGKNTEIPGQFDLSRSDRLYGYLENIYGNIHVTLESKDEIIIRRESDMYDFYFKMQRKN